jgi:hypothetical protein
MVQFSTTPQQDTRTAMASPLRARARGVPTPPPTNHLASLRGKRASYYAEA